MTPRWSLSNRRQRSGNSVTGRSLAGGSDRPGARTEERLIDALDAFVRAQDEATFRPLRNPARGRHRPAWFAPVAAAASLLVVVGLGLGVSGRLPGPGGSGSVGTVIAPHRYYITQNLNADRPVVRSTVTGAVTATVPVPRAPDTAASDIVASAADGWYFVVANMSDHQAQQIYRFQATDTGRIARFSAVRGGLIGNGQWAADAVAASPDGSQLAVAVGYQGQFQCPRKENSCWVSGSNMYPDYIVIVNVATGTERIWQGGMGGRGTYFSISSLSWTGHGRELVFLGQSCGGGSLNSEACDLPVKGRTFRNTHIIRALDPATRGGLLTSGPELLR
jgi:hypothetical protein